MATPIPLYATQVFPTAETLQVTTGTLQSLPTTRYYYLISNRTTASDGQSLLYEIKTLLDASLAGTAWTVTLAKQASTGLYKINMSHNNGSSRTVTFSSSFATALGFANASFAVANGTTVVADYPSYWTWTPDMPVSLTGPKMFDPSITHGVPVSNSVAQRAPDGVTAYMQNGVLYDAEYTFNGVQYLYKAYPQSGYTNRDLQTWWLNGPAQGRRVLMWRDRDNATGSNAPSEGTSSPYNYIEYAPQESLTRNFPASPTAPNNLLWWDVKLDFWVTENGETPLTD